MKHDFISIGGATRDISFFTDEGVLLDNHRDLKRQKLLAFEAEAKIKVDKFYYSFGGGAANAAVYLSRFGFKTVILAALGDDANSHLIIKNLRAQAVDTSFLAKTKSEESGASFVLISPGGERIIFAQRGANRCLKIGALQAAALKKIPNVYIASLSGDWLSVLRRIFSNISTKTQVFWNPGQTQYAKGADPLLSFFKKTTVLASNKDEAIDLVLNSPGYSHLHSSFLNKTENLLKIMYSFGPRLVLITMGAEGVMAFDGHQMYFRPIIKEKKRVDSTGVGDVFNSSFAAGFVLFSGDINKSLDLALRRASDKVAHLGAQGALSTMPRRLQKI